MGRWGWGTAAREHALCQLVGDPLRLPKVPVTAVDGGAPGPVTVQRMPTDDRDANVGDAIAIAHLVVAHRPTRGPAGRHVLRGLTHMRQV